MYLSISWLLVAIPYIIFCFLQSSPSPLPLYLFIYLFLLGVEDCLDFFFFFFSLPGSFLWLGLHFRPTWDSMMGRLQVTPLFRRQDTAGFLNFLKFNSWCNGDISLPLLLPDLTIQSDGTHSLGMIDLTDRVQNFCKISRFQSLKGVDFIY